MSHARAVFVAIAGTVAFAVSGCAGTSTPPQKTTPEASSTSGAPSTAASPAASPAAELTKPGTRLRVGERAILPSRDATIGVTVTAIKKGDRRAFVNRFGARAKGIVPYFIRYSVENVDGSDLSFRSAPYVTPITATGGSTGAVVSGSMDGCERQSAPRNFTKVGATFTTCRLTGARAGVKITGVKFTDDDYRDDPVVWKR